MLNCLLGIKQCKETKRNKSIITEYKLVIFFLSSWAANELATVQDIKSIKNHYGMELIQNHTIWFSDERLDELKPY